MPEQGTVWFGNELASFYTWKSGAELEVRAPLAAAPGPVDVHVETLDGERVTLPLGYTYINPESGWGGTWGGTIQEVLNVTVKDIWLDTGVEDAFVVAELESGETLQGVTNWVGQVLFSLPDGEDVQSITAWKDGYSASTIVEFDAENATVLLFPEQPTSNSNGGGGASENPFGQLGTIEGKVLFNGKYLTPPPGNCPDQPLDPESFLCGVCESNEQCGGGEISAHPCRMARLIVQRPAKPEQTARPGTPAFL